MKRVHKKAHEIYQMLSDYQVILDTIFGGNDDCIRQDIRILSSLLLSGVQKQRRIGEYQSLPKPGVDN